MATFTLDGPLPSITIEPTMKLRIVAISPTTGAEISGVTAIRWAIYGETSQAGGGDTSSGPFMLVPGPVAVGNPGDSAGALAVR